MSQRWSAIFCATGVWGGKHRNNFHQYTRFPKIPKFVYHMASTKATMNCFCVTGFVTVPDLIVEVELRFTPKMFSRPWRLQKSYAYGCMQRTFRKNIWNIISIRMGLLKIFSLIWQFYQVRQEVKSRRDFSKIK